MSVSAKIKIDNIRLTRAEGPSDECGKPVAYAAVTAANAQLSQWSESAPKTGSCDKCDFAIEFDDGAIYEGTYDLKHHSIQMPDVIEHVRSMALFHTARHTPAHLTLDRHRALLQSPNYVPIRAYYEDLLQRYEIGLVDIPPSAF